MSTVERPVSNGRTDSGDGGGSSQPWNPLRGKDGGMFSAFTRRRTDPPAVVVPTRSAETLVPRSSSAGVDGLSDYNAGPPVSDHAQQHGVLKHHASAVLAEASGPTGSGNNSGSNSGNVTDSGSGGGFGKKLTSRLKKEYASAISLNTKRQQQHVDTLLSQGSTDTSLQGPTVRGLPVSNPISFQHVEHLSPTELSVQAKPIAETLVSWPNMSLDADKRASTSRGRKQSAGHIRMLSGSSNARKLSVGHVRNLSVDKALNPLEDDNSRKTLTVRGLPVSDPMEFEHIEHFSPTEYTLKQYQRARPGQQPVQYQHQQPLQPQYQQPIQHQYQQQIQHQYQHQYQHQQHQQHQYQQQQAHPPPQQQQLPPQSQFTQLNVISTPNRANKLGDKAQRVPTVRGLAVGQPMDFRHVEHLSPTDHSILQYQDLNHNQQVKEMVSVATVPNVTSDKMRGGTVRGLPVSGPVSFTHVKHVSQSEYKTQIKKYMETIATQPSASSKGPDQAPTVRGLPVSNPTAFAHVGHFSPADYERQQQQQQQQGHKQQQGQQQGSPPPALTVRGLPVSSPMAFQHIEHYSPSEFASQYRLLREQEPPAPGHAGGSNPPLFGSTSRALPSDSKQHARSPKSATSTMSDRGRQLHRPSSQSQMLSRFKRPSAKASSPDIQASHKPLHPIPRLVRSPARTRNNRAPHIRVR
ncbi:hypothetical protein GQ54DRAFT_302458 [Martensiomyces pterosporus]|nr:hypothetical protein GQ54DRAFT_302458 [Martensiomyces pterosporus]